MFKRWSYVALGTVGLVMLGFICGTVAGTLIVMGVVVPRGNFPPLNHIPKIILLSAVLGGPIGALVAPLAWLPLRRVSLSRTICTTAAGTVIGGVVAANLAVFLDDGEAAFFVVFPGTLLGFCAAGALLYLKMQRDDVPGRHFT
jgi:hypothetical protein